MALGWEPSSVHGGGGSGASQACRATGLLPVYQLEKSWVAASPLPRPRGGSGTRLGGPSLGCCLLSFAPLARGGEERGIIINPNVLVTFSWNTRTQGGRLQSLEWQVGRSTPASPQPPTPALPRWSSDPMDCTSPALQLVPGSHPDSLGSACKGPVSSWAPPASDPTQQSK